MKDTNVNQEAKDCWCRIGEVILGRVKYALEDSVEYKEGMTAEDFIKEANEKVMLEVGCWVEWTAQPNTDAPPVPERTRVDIRLRDGTIYHKQIAGDWTWGQFTNNYSEEDDIVAYRICNKSTDIKTKEDQLCVHTTSNDLNIIQVSDVVEWSCVGKGGVYVIVDLPKGAGKSKVFEDVIVYADVRTSKTYWRFKHDFLSRMEVIGDGNSEQKIKNKSC